MDMGWKHWWNKFCLQLETELVMIHPNLLLLDQEPVRKSSYECSPSFQFRERLPVRKEFQRRGYPECRWLYRLFWPISRVSLQSFCCFIQLLYFLLQLYQYWAYCCNSLDRHWWTQNHTRFALKQLTFRDSPKTHVYPSIKGFSTVWCQWILP